MSWLTLLAWFAGTKTGRIAGVITLTLAMIAIALAMAFRRGGAAERSAATTAVLDHIRKRMTSDDEIARLPVAERCDRLMRWARD